MKKILQIIDIKGWAIGTLADAVIKHNPHFDWKQIAVHPKDLELGKVDLKPIIEAIKWADVIDGEYWRTMSQLFDMIPELKTKPVLITHHNEKNILSYEWPENVIHVVETKYSEDLIKEHYPNAKVYFAPVGFNANEFEWNQEYPPAEKAVGYVGRVVPWKGLKDLAKACYELKYPLMLMGKIDKVSYWNEIPQEHRDNIDLSYMNCEPHERQEFYKNITCYVGNSGSGRETGPMGLVEALIVGVPCVTTAAGIAADIHDDENENMVMVDYDDYNGLKEAIQRVMESPSLQAELRKNGWNTIRGYNLERRSSVYRDAINDLIYKNDLVSVIIPCTPKDLGESIIEKPNENVFKILDALESQTYKDLEAVVVIDQCLDADQAYLKLVEAVKSRYSYPIKVKATNVNGGYNLAMARNIGLIEADGKYIMLNDSRLKPENDAVEKMLSALHERGDDEKLWVFGEKGGEKSTFVENFSMIQRKHLIKGGMFNERITAYGGMSQELRGRFASQGFEFGYIPTAKAEQMIKSSLSPAKRKGIIEMKNLLFKLNLN